MMVNKVIKKTNNKNKVKKLNPNSSRLACQIYDLIMIPM